MKRQAFMGYLIAAILCVAVAVSFVPNEGVSGFASRDISHAGCASAVHKSANHDGDPEAPPFDLAEVPAYDGAPSVQVHDNEPYFSSADFDTQAFEQYTALDLRGRCGTAFALVGRETMPTVQRGSIGMVRPSGWKIARYPWIDGEYLFNRCHLVGFQLTGQNDNERNLITGTRFMNVNGMLPYEDQVASYVRRTGNHVLYRVTPLFSKRNLVASGVLMEAESVEDNGAGVCFCVWCYNVEPGVEIDYATGESRADGTISSEGMQGEAFFSDGVSAGDAQGDDAGQNGEAQPLESIEIDSAATYVVNASSGKFHRPDCPSVFDMADKNRTMFYGSREEALEAGYVPCGWCKP